MVARTLAFLAGILLFQQSAVLPPAWAVGLIVSLWLLPPWLPRPARRTAWLLPIAGVGFLWAWGQAALVLRTALPPALEGRDLRIEGTISSLPRAEGERTRFQFDTLAADPAGGRASVFPGRLLLSWYGTAPPLCAGQRWRLTVRLRRPHGMVNPGGFDYERWLFQRRIRATGYVRPAGARLLAPADGHALLRLRQMLRDRLRAALGRRPLAGIVIALAIGDRQGIDDDQWQVLRATGTTHLVAISGLHIGIVAGLVFFLLRWLWPWSERLALWLPAPRAAAVAALAAAAGYAALAGFSLPTQRALIMVAVAMAAVWWRRPLRRARTLAVALLLVLLFDPSAPLAPGFWLSFGAVALILYGMGARLAAAGWWWRWGRVQWLAGLGLAPLLALWFQQVPLLSPLANLVAVPWVTLTTVPLTLLGTAATVVLPPAAPWLLAAACHSLDGLWWLLVHLAPLQPRWGAFTPPPWTLAPALVGLVWLFAPRGWPARWVGAVWLLPLVLARPPGPAPGELWLTLLDVGQGLSAVVRTAGHTLVYDTGPRYGGRLDAGNAVIVPFLRTAGVRTVDLLMVSHGDMDHDGGTASVLAAVSVRRVLTGMRRWSLPQAAQPCLAGTAWRWDGVRFEILSPPPDVGQRSGNDRSCVLRVSADGGSVLLPGDIGQTAEAALVDTAAGRLRSTVLIAPHHGSATSSGTPFVTAVAPRYVLFAVGYRNRYRFPSRRVTARYRAEGAERLDSDRSGAITIRFTAVGTTVERYRQRARRYWYSR